MKTNQLFNDCNSWNDFQTKLLTLQKKEKGDAFEFLTKLYFKIHPVYSFYDDVWLLNEVPQKIIEHLGIPSHDLGIDLIAKNGDEYHAIQCKFHTDINSSVSFKEVATFISMLEGNSFHNVSLIILFKIKIFKVFFLSNLNLINRGNIIKSFGRLT